jgi:hypothetical protein
MGPGWFVRAVERARPKALPAILALGTLVFGVIVHRHYPIRHWLFWSYIGHSFLAVCMTFAWVLAGGAVLSRLRVTLPLGERVVMSFATGMYLYFAIMFVVGLLHSYGRAFAVLLPVALGVAGIAGTKRRLKRYVPLVRRALSGPVRMRSLSSAAILLFGAGGLLLVYVPILSPNNVASDAHWYHLPLAEHYVAEGGISRSVEGSFPAAYPQLATIVYSWAFMLPHTSLFDRIMIAGHLEFAIFLGTLLGVGVLAARVAPRARPTLAWTSVFLFPGIFLYDSNLSLGADHVLAFWAPPIFLTLIRALEAPSVRRGLLFGIVLAGAVLTKHQAGCLVVVPALAVIVAALATLVKKTQRKEESSAMRCALVAGSAALILSSPHWLKNAVWYHDPLYPLLHRVLPSRPWGPDADSFFDNVFIPNNFWRPTGTFGQKLLQTARALFTFSFIPNDWPGMHGMVPVFGSLFTLTSFSAPFLGKRRLLGLVLVSYAAVFIWYWASHQDRYLQAIVPWFAASTAAVIAEAWYSGLATRAAVAALVGLQIVWGGDVPFIDQAGIQRLKMSVDFLSSGYRRAFAERSNVFSPWPTLAKRIPKGAKVLLHGCVQSLGLGAMTVSNFWQGALSYGRYRSFAEMNRSLRNMGITHMLWIKDLSPGVHNVADDLIFLSFAKRYGREEQDVDNYHVAKLPLGDIPDNAFGSVLFWGTGESYASGLYHVDQLTTPDPGWGRPCTYPPPFEAAQGREKQLVARATFVVASSDASKNFPFDGFVKVHTRGKYAFFMRNPSASPRVATQ